ncbi:trehalose-phosphatase [Mycolicibacterium moriokaense]|uniref:Glycosyl hydrolase n=1 Tax=Mycolicibacterium moriokaense TaxID=39691 RepID=A0AAD1M7G9_9MYCO|nr:trehalose-phosphatase [Mycolicibacterium moriokaense]MCV7039378.1 trehalose-phosphatase [Mycolicibacterium moriokaense]ORB26796.1 trehalose-phosphatase [Mycolicibacterium moriokaense]BBX03902.1 putative glycosyl hydrolase [Mycolicibacterium moriokaense]
MKATATIDPRFYDAVVFGLDAVVTETAPNDGWAVSDSTVALVRKLAEAGVATAVYCPGRNSEQVLKAAGLDDLFDIHADGLVADALGLPGQPDPAVLLAATNRLETTPARTAVVEAAEAGVQAARNGGFGLVIWVDHTGLATQLRQSGADVVVENLAQITVRRGDKRISQLPNALDSYGQLVGIVAGRQPFVCLDFDGTLAEIVAEPDAAELVEGAAKTLERLAALCPVAILSGRDLADVRERMAIPGIWYSGSHGFEIVGPDGAHRHNDAAAAAVPILESVAAELREDLGEIPGVNIEHKRYAVAVHYRNVAPEQVADVVATTRRRGQRRGLRVTGGRKIVELRPDIDWDKGTALGWLRDQIHQTGRVLPIFIGDDLTDEDAFDALRFNGVGIVVRHDEDGDRDRATAAQFMLNSPTEVEEFLRRGGDWLAYEQQTSDEAWTLTYDGYDPPNEKLREALCTVGNGYFATRGAAPESKAGQVHYPGTYAAGVFNRLDDVIAGTTTAHESLVNLPNWLPLTFRIDGGPWFDVDEVELLDYRQVLDIQRAVLTRELRFRDHAGRTTSVSQHRFVAMHQAHVAAMEMTVTAEDWSGTIEVRSTLDGHVGNTMVERYRDLASTHLTSPKKHALTPNSVLLEVSTTQSQIPVALAARTTVWRDGQPAPATYRLVDEEFEIGHEIFAELTAGQSVSVEKVVTLVTGRDVATSEPAASAERRLGRQERFAEIRDAHALRWAHLWERLSIQFEDHADELRILRLHLLHLLQTVSYNSEDLDVGVPARGLHGEAYRGHIFWDELFIFPVLNLRLPSITRSLLRYRYRRLVEARRAAKLAGYDGAMFPWQSGSDGREESPVLHLNPRSGRWNPDPSHRAHHIGIAVAYNVWQYYQVTGDLAYLIDYGAEMLAEIARFWVSRSTYDEERDRYNINGVIGPDEFHTGYPGRPFEGIDNNAYTNVMAVWVIMRAMDALKLLPLPSRIDFRERLRLTDAELQRWDHVSRRMFVPFCDGRISQFEGYDELAELDWDAYRTRYGNIQRLDRILEAEGDDINRYKASKQADALMLLYLLSSDELREVLHRLDYSLAPEQIPEMVDYYLARTSHGSTLSGVVHTWVLARANRDRAMEFFEQVLKSDVADIQGGTTSEGIHLAAMAGSVDLIQRCFTGLETRGDRMVLSPHWPDSLGALGFPVHYRGHHVYIRVSGKGAEVSVDPCDVPPVVIECRGRVEQLRPGCTVRFPSGSFDAR